jgi:predicted metalloprotease with PDZ domain
MKRITWFLAFGLIIAIAAPVAMAGDYGKCTAGTQECLDQMAQKLKNKGWIGVELNDESGQLVIAKVVAESPAEEAGLEEGDVLFAVAGVEYKEENKEKVSEIRKDMTPGKSFTFTILKNGKKEKDVEIVLGTLPDDVLAQWVGSHMIDHASAEQAEE